MQAVLIAMTILGCNDAVTQCNYVATVEKHWETVAMCDAESERQLKRFSNVSYPTVIAVCEPPKAPLSPEPPKVAAAPAPAPQQATVDTKSSLAALADRVSNEVRAHLPSRKAMETTLAKPVHFVSGSYSWVVKRLGD